MKNNKGIWIVLGILAVILGLSSIGILDISTPFSEAITYEDFGAGYSSTTGTLIKEADSSSVSFADGKMSVNSACLKGISLPNCGLFQCQSRDKAYWISAKDFKTNYVKVFVDKIPGGQFAGNYQGASVCIGSSVNKICVGAGPIKYEACGATFYGEAPSMLFEWLPSNLEPGKGWIFINGQQFQEVAAGSLSEYKIILETGQQYDYIKYNIPWSCHISPGEGFGRQRFTTGQPIDLSSLAKEPRKFCLSQPARIIRDNNIIADAEIYDLVAKGGSYTVKDNELVDFYYIFDQNNCLINEYFDFASASCKLLSQAIFSCTNGQYDSLSGGCIVAPEIRTITVEVEVEVPRAIECPDGFDKQLINGLGVCISYSPEIVQIESGKDITQIDNIDSVSFINKLSSRLPAISGSSVITLLFILGIAGIIIYYIMGKRK